MVAGQKGSETMAHGDRDVKSRIWRGAVQGYRPGWMNVVAAQFVSASLGEAGLDDNATGHSLTAIITVGNEGRENGVNAKLQAVGARPEVESQEGPSTRRMIPGVFQIFENHTSGRDWHQAGDPEDGVPGT